MAKFKYRMQNILDIKMKLESQERINFANANAALFAEQKKLQELMVRRVGYERKLKELMTGTLDIRAVNSARADITTMKTMIRRQMMNVRKAEMLVEEARKKLNQVMQERKTHEILKEKAFEEFKQELAREESKEIDQLVSYTYNNR